MSGPPIDGCRSAGGLRHALAGLLRHLATRLDPAPPEPEPDLIAISRARLREAQEQGLRMVADYAALGRDGDGMLWFPVEALKSIAWLIADELGGRDRDFELVERDPTVRLR